MTLEEINIKLVDIYGISNDGNPRFRLVKASEQWEKKIGTFREYVKGTDIFLREFIGARDVLKYWFSDAVYVLERYVKEAFLDIYPASRCPEDTHESTWNGYEAYFCFDSAAILNNQHLEVPPWKAVNFLIKTNLMINRKERDAELTPKALKETEEKAIRIEKEQAYEYLSQELLPELPNRLKDGTAVVVPGVKDE